MLKGLPACGKTSRAMDLVKKGYKRINNDDLRDMVDGYKFTKENEDTIGLIRRFMLYNFMRLGHDIVVDNTNFNPKCLQEIEQVMEDFSDKYEIVEEFVDTPLEECIRRDALRTGRHHVGKNVIKGMYDKYLKKEIPKAKLIEGAPQAIVCDIDGTLAICGDRDIYDGSKAYLDTVKDEIREILERFSETHTIVIVSGRDDSHRDVTRKWLIDKGIPFDELWMRPEGDRRKDSVVKQEIYDQCIKGKYNIKFVLDDRDQVVEMWRANGLTCLQVAEGNF